MTIEGDRLLLRHFLGALAYRTQKALREAPPEFGDFRAAKGVRTPKQLLRHMSDVLGFARAEIRGERWRARSLDSLAAEAGRFHEVLEALGGEIEHASFTSFTPAQLLQGPLADAMTHAGQLAMLRRLAGAPIPPENFFAAGISPDQLGPDQPTAPDPDTQWYDAEDEPW